MAGPERLIGWKRIAAHLGCDVRTARRWEAERGLPVHRLPGDARSAVWADPAELGRWLAGQPATTAGPHEAPPAPAATPLPAAAAVLPAAAAAATGASPWPGPAPAMAPPARPALSAARSYASARRPLALAALGALAVAAAALGLTAERRPAGAARDAPYGADEAANRSFRDAAYAKASRTPDGLDQAAGLFAALARAHPDNPAAHVGLAETYLLMREFAGLSDEAAYRRARDAATRALALEPDDPAATRALAFALFWSEADKPQGLALFARAAELAPQDARTHHWRGNALVFAGRYAEGLDSLARARALAPESSAIAADEAHIRFLLANAPAARAEALAALRRVTEVDPAFIGAWRYLEWDLLAGGDDAGFLAAARQHARLAGRPQRLATLNAAEAALRAGGRPAMLATLVAAAEARHRETREDALSVARLHALAGDRAATRAWIARARALGEPHAFMLAGWPELRPLMREPGFAAEFADAAPSRPLPPAQALSR